MIAQRVQPQSTSLDTRPTVWPHGLPADATRLACALKARNGSVLRVRAIRPDDMERLIAFHRRLSPQTITARYFTPLPVLSPERARQLTHIDYVDRMALVATIGYGPDEQIVAVVRYVRSDSTSAEVAFVIEDPWQGQGLATQLLYRLAAYARERGYTALVAQTLVDNRRMRDVVRFAGFPFTATYEDGCVVLRMDITQRPYPQFTASEEVAVEPVMS